MNEYAWVSLISIFAWLVLAVGALRAHQLGARKLITLALTWLAIFGLGTAIFTVVGR